MARKTPAQVAQNWTSGLSGKGISNYKSGVQDVSVSPGAVAAERSDKYLASVNDAVNSGRYRNGQLSYSLQDWKQQASTKGASNLGTAAQQSQGKVASFMQKALPEIYQLSDQIKQMPANSKSDNKARMNAWFDASSNLKGKFKG
jgi:hypothetical protein